MLPSCRFLKFRHDDDDDGPLVEIIEMYANLINRLGDSEEALSLGLEVSYSAKKTSPIISGLPGIPQAIHILSWSGDSCR
jgi:hypothetical protein